MSTHRNIGLSVLLAAVLGFASCDRPISGETATPTTGGDGPSVDPDPEGRNEGSGMNELRGRLEELVRKAESMGAVVASDAAKCEDLCDLATSICSVQAKMKELCDAHPDDDQYAALCREAKNECREAQDSCVRCVESNQAK
jgi:hypothetical protein